MATNQNTVLAVEGMSCRCCASRIERALDPLGGVSNVSVDLEKSFVAVDHDSRTSKAALISALREAGYESKVAR